MSLEEGFESEVNLDKDFLEAVEVMQRAEEHLREAVYKAINRLAVELDVKLTVPEEFIKAFEKRDKV